MRQRLLDWVDDQMAESWPAYVFLAFLVMLGCVCGGALGGILGAFLS